MPIVKQSSNNKVRISRLLLATFMAFGFIACDQRTPETGGLASAQREGLTRMGKLQKRLAKFQELTSAEVNEINNSKGALSEQLALKLTAFDEFQFADIQKSVLFKWEKSWKQKDRNAFTRLLTEDISFTTPNLDINKPLREKDGIIEYKVEKLYVAKSKTAATKTAESYLNSLGDIYDFDIDINRVRAPASFRDLKTLKMKKAWLFGYYDLRTKLGAARRHDTGNIRILVAKENNRWKIKKFRFDSLRIAKTERKAAFSKNARTTFPNGIPKTYLRGEAMRRGGYAIALADTNNDSNIDFYLGAEGKATLWQGNGKGQFTEAKDVGLENDKMIKSATFADFDNDSDQDLVLTSFVPDRTFLEEIKVYRNDGDGTFSAVGDPVKDRVNSHYPMPLTVADFNGDSYLDFYVGFPGARDFTFKSGYAAKDERAVQGVFFNDTKGTFYEATKHAGISRYPLNETGEHQGLYPHSAMAIDFDRDKDIDIIVIDDRGNLSPMYQNKGDGSFQKVNKKLGINIADWGMSTAAGDLNNDGLIDFAFTNVNFNVATRVLNAKYEGRLRQSSIGEALGANGLNIYLNAGNGKYKEVSSSMLPGYEGQGVAGVEFLDYNNDGLQDIYLANGLWSGSTEYQDISRYFIVESQFNHEVNEDLRDLPRGTSQSDYMNLLKLFRGNLDNLQEQVNHAPSMAGYQRNRLYRNNGDGTFTDVAFLEGVDSIADGYIVAIGDIDKNGAVDILLRNGDPGTELNKFEPVEVYSNNLIGKSKNSIRIKLSGIHSAKDAIGVGVTVVTKNRKQYRQLIANNGPAQSEKVLHFGIGSEEKAEQVIIDWFSGTQYITNVSKGMHTFVEPTKMGSF